MWLSESNTHCHAARLTIEDPEGDGGSKASDTAEKPFRPNQRTRSCTMIALQLRPEFPRLHLSVLKSFQHL